MAAVREVGEKYRCAVCGNEVEVIRAGGGELVCCGQPMQIMEGQPEPAVPGEDQEAQDEDFDSEEEPAMLPPEEEERPQTF